jgi:hypothetical protein
MISNSETVNENPMPAQRWLASSDLVSKLSKSAWTLRIAISVALVIPCFWQPIVSAVDLQSHLYNAWLSELIRSGSIRGLWIGHQSTNLVVDIIFAWLLKILGVSVSERVVTSVLVLVFFWGAFQLISAVRGQPAYWLAPWLAILSYGFAFQCGLLNYYLSCGIVLWLFAFLWARPIGFRTLWTAPFLILAYLAHPLPVLWFVGVAAYCQVARRHPLRLQGLLFLGSVVVLFLIRGYIAARYVTVWMPRQLLYWTGADQALLYGGLYLLVAMAFLFFNVIFIIKSKNNWRAYVNVPAQGFFITAIGIMLIPSSIRASIEQAEVSHIADRVSLFSGVLLLAVVGCAVYRRWHFAAGLVTAAIFFGVLYRDVGREARVEAKMEQLVHLLPVGGRVVFYDHLTDGEERSYVRTRKERLTHLTGRLASIFTERLNSNHLLSRACLGHCYDYMNYEPSTGQFRIRATPGNPVVIARHTDFVRLVGGTYVVTATDLPLYALLRCGESSEDIRLHPLTEGESGEILACAEMSVAR